MRRNKLADTNFTMSQRVLIQYKNFCFINKKMKLIFSATSRKRKKLTNNKKIHKKTSFLSIKYMKCFVYKYKCNCFKKQNLVYH